MALRAAGSTELDHPMSKGNQDTIALVDIVKPWVVHIPIKEVKSGVKAPSDFNCG